MKRVHVTLLALAHGCGPAADDAANTDDTDVVVEEGFLEPPPEDEGFQLELLATAPAGEEIWICDVRAMPNTAIANVSWVEVRQNKGTHHVTLSSLGLLPTPEPPVAYGRYDCNDLYGDASLMEDQVMFYGNQGVAEDEMHLPEGVAATFPPGLHMIHEIHFVNTTNEDIELYNRVNAWTIRDSQVESGIWGGSVRDEHINIPASSEHTEWSRCVMNRDVEVLFLASHTHELGVEFNVRRFDGAETGDIMYTNDDWHVPLIEQYEEPLIVAEGEGFEWSCTWDNPNDHVVNYGLDSTDEMCNLAVVHTPFDPGALCEVVETSDGVLYDPNE